MQNPPDTDAAFREIRRMVVAGSSVLLLVGIFTGVFLERVRRDTVVRERLAIEAYQNLLSRFEKAKGSFAQLQTDNALIANENERLRMASSTLMQESALALDRMQGLSAKLAVYGAVIAKNIETVHPDAALRDAPAEAPEEHKAIVIQERNKITELERQLELSRKATLYFARYAESLAAGKKADPEARQAMLENALNAIGVTEQQYHDLVKTP